MLRFSLLTLLCLASVPGNNPTGNKTSAKIPPRKPLRKISFEKMACNNPSSKKLFFITSRGFLSLFRKTFNIGA